MGCPQGFGMIELMGVQTMNVIWRCWLTGTLILSTLVALPSISAADTTRTIYVKLLVDEEEAALPRLWQERLSKRLLGANEILSHYCDVRFTPIAFERWQSDDRVQELSRSLRELEQEVSPEPGHIAIGFSSQYKFSPGRNSLGGTRGPMRGHILIRESAPNIHEPERLEVLVHELGHFLGAAHSSHPQSAMRPVLGDGQALVRDFQIGFDSENAKVLQLVSKEIRERSVRHFLQLTDPTLRELRVQYVTLLDQQPNDPTAKRFLRIVDAVLQRRSELRSATSATR